MHTSNFKLKSGKQQRGIAIVEFVIAAPVVLFIALVIAEFGYALSQYNTLTQSLRDAARQLASTAAFAPSEDDITEASNLIAYGSSIAGQPLLPGLSPDQVGWNTVTSPTGDIFISLRVDYPYQPLLTGGIPRVFRSGTENNTFTMSAEMVVRPLL